MMMIVVVVSRVKIMINDRLEFHNVRKSVSAHCWLSLVIIAYEEIDIQIDIQTEIS
jgi:hypothetical protein